jgi:exodeoxyribonuclease V alpha subunit
MVQQREITGKFLNECFVFVSPDGLTRTIIGDVQTGNGIQKIKGDVAHGELIEGLTYRFYGHTANHWKHGPQFAFDSYVIDAPADQDAVEIYLQQLDGIGPRKAALLFDRYGADAVRMIREQPAEAAAAVNWNPDQAKDASQQLRLWQRIEGAKLDLLGLLHGRGLPKKTIEKLIEDFGSAAASIVKRNPYLLMRYNGIGWLKADAVYTEFGLNPARIKRQSLCAWHALASNRDGDTWFKSSVAHDALLKNVAGASVNFPRAMRLSLRAGLLDEMLDVSGLYWVAERRKSEAEQRVADYLHLAATETTTTWPNLDAIDDAVSLHQECELTNATHEPIGVLAGTPGTGKTYTSAALVKLLISLVGQDQVAVAAPTGKAAVRLTDAMNRSQISLRATTIHSLLGVMSAEDGWQFTYNERKPLPFKFVVIDESSMIDTDLMGSLLSARGRGTCFLFVGDPNQLSPVGHGAPLRDMIAAGVPTGTLTEIQRNSGRIIKACAEIREGKRFSTSPAIDLETAENLKLVSVATPDDQIESLTTIMSQFAAERPRRYDPIWDVQILVAVNKKSLLGRKPLNARLQSLLNPHGETCQGSPFRVGDKIINGKNGEFPSADPGSKVKLYVANGEQAEVLKVEPRRTIARLTAPDRIIVIPQGAGSDDDNDDDSTGTGCNWELGYAISTHKSQGSEWPIVIVMLDEYYGARSVCSRQWLYTGISRAKLLCLLIGKKPTADAMVARDALFKRKTFLVERLSELRRPKPVYDFDSILSAI